MILDSYGVPAISHDTSKRVISNTSESERTDN